MLRNQIETIGNTPIVQLSKFHPPGNLYGKLEGNNPLSSVKCRSVWGMVRYAEMNGTLQEGSEIVEPTSGNTGIGLAWISRLRGYKLTLTMPESMSEERKSMLRFLGAELILTDASKGMKGAIEKAEKIVKKRNAVYLDQFSHPGNPQIHYETTGPEIWKDMNAEVDYVVMGVGTGGTLSGVGKFLKDQEANIQIIAVEPLNSQVIAGKNPGPHALQGLGAGFIPVNLDMNVVDGTEAVSDGDAMGGSQLLAQTEGIVAGISSGAAIIAALRLAEANPTKKVVAILPDNGERYMSTELFF